MAQKETLIPRWQNLLQQLYLKMDFMSGEELAELLKVHARTIRSDIKSINEIFSKEGNRIVSVRGKGYQLQLQDESVFLELLAPSKEERFNLQVIPTLAQDRIPYIIRYLLLQNDFVKLDTLAEELYVSKSTINSDMVDVKRKLAECSLILSKRAGYGVKIEGSEMNMRFCFSKYLLSDSVSLLVSDEEQTFFGEIDLRNIQTVILTSLAEYKVQMTDMAVKNLIIHVAIAIRRIKNQQYIEQNELQGLEFNIQELRAVQKMIREIERLESIQFPESELTYILLHVCSKHVLQSYNGYREVILVHKMLAEIKRRYGYDFSAHQQFIAHLALHLKPAINRIKFHMNIHNPYLSNIKKNYPLAFEFGLLAREVLIEELNQAINEDEAGYMAMHFLYALSEEPNNRKKRVLLVCASGIGTAKLLEIKIKKLFDTEIEIIGSCSLYEYQKNEQEADFIVSTVPIEASKHAYVQVTPFLSKADIRGIERLLTKDENHAIFNPISLFFSKKYFTILEGKRTKEEILTTLANKFEVEGNVQASFLESVKERENIVATYLGNGLAAPHPISADVKETKIAVCITKEPIVWNEERDEVQIILMLAVKNKEQEQLSTVYEIISQVVEIPKLAKEIREVADFEAFIRILEHVKT